MLSKWVCLYTLVEDGCETHSNPSTTPEFAEQWHGRHCQHPPSRALLSLTSAPPLPPAATAAAAAAAAAAVEYCDLGTLTSFTSKVLSDPSDDEQMVQLLVLLQDAARGIAALHSNSVVHGDGEAL